MKNDFRYFQNEPNKTARMVFFAITINMRDEVDHYILEMEGYKVNHIMEI